MWVEHSYIGELRSFEAVKVSAVSSFTEIVESKDKSFVLDLKLLFKIGRASCRERVSPRV